MWNMKSTVTGAVVVLCYFATYTSGAPQRPDGGTPSPLPTPRPGGILSQLFGEIKEFQNEFRQAVKDRSGPPPFNPLSQIAGIIGPQRHRPHHNHHNSGRPGQEGKQRPQEEDPPIEEPLEQPLRGLLIIGKKPRPSKRPPVEPFDGELPPAPQNIAPFTGELPLPPPNKPQKSVNTFPGELPPKSVEPFDGELPPMPGAPIPEFDGSLPPPPGETPMAPTTKSNSPLPNITANRKIINAPCIGGQAHDGCRKAFET